MKSREFFVYTVSDPAPFFGDPDTEFRRGSSADAVLKRVQKTYKHPDGLHYVAVYKSADDYHKGKKPLASWKHKCSFETVGNG